MECCQIGMCPQSITNYLLGRRVHKNTFIEGRIIVPFLCHPFIPYREIVNNRNGENLLIVIKRLTDFYWRELSK